MVSLPKIVDGGLSVDDRGTVTFCNDFDFKDVKRFYMVQNHSKGFIRAWHGHKKEGKYVLVTKGTIMLSVMPLDALGEIDTFTLSDKKPQVLFIPAGNYNGFKTLTEDAQIMFFSTSTLEESKGDDIRLSAKEFKEVWEVEER